MKQFFLILFTLLVLSCAGPNDGSSNPIERAGNYVAGAIVTAAVIRAVCNK